MQTPHPAPQRLNCFSRAMRETRPVHHAVPAWANAWCSTVAENGLALDDARQEAFARIVPLLICGEQSAIVVFGQADAAKDSAARSAFAAIEHDEAGHELAWQALAARLPKPTDQNALRRRAQLFFSRLGRNRSAGEHFAQVAHLDSAVGSMMWHLERSAVAKDVAVAKLANRVKSDEARHVMISRRHARELGVSRQRYENLGVVVREQLVTLLEPIGDALEVIGIDTSAMFRRVLHRPMERTGR